MTSSVLTRTLDEELEALLAGETRECLVCGEPVEVGGGRVSCVACGSVLHARPPDVIEGQLALV
jgi:hypothetical protein